MIMKNNKEYKQINELFSQNLVIRFPLMYRTVGISGIIILILLLIIRTELIEEIGSFAFYVFIICFLIGTIILIWSYLVLRMTIETDCIIFRVFFAREREINFEEIAKIKVKKNSLPDESPLGLIKTAII